MRGLFRFIGQSISSAVGRSIFAAVLLLMGITPEWIENAIRSGIPGLPAYATSPIVRLALIAVAFLIVASIFYRQVEWYRNLRPMPNMRVGDAIDYIVNDSIALLKQPGPPTILQYGPARGAPLIERAVQHTDAVMKFNERAISGDVTVWGYREINPNFSSSSFEQTIREIQKSYWDASSVSPAVFFHHSQNTPHTETPHGAFRYSGLMTHREQVYRAWPPKPWWHRFWDRRIRRKQRIAPN